MTGGSPAGHHRRRGRGDDLFGRLASARAWDDVADVLWHAAGGMGGAVATGLAMPGATGRCLDFVPSVGWRRTPAERWAPVAVAADLPVAEVARTGSPLFFEDPGAFLRRYPELRGAQGATGDRSWAILPVAGPLLAAPGVLAVAWDTPRSFDREDRAALAMVGRFCATVLAGVPARS